MPVSEKTYRVQEKSNGQVVVTIDRGIADAMGLVGADISYNVESRDRLSMTVQQRSTE